MNKQDKLIASIRGLILDSQNATGNGHSGMALGSSGVFATLFTKYLKIWKDNPKWINRDKFVLSAGHACLGFYAITHFMGLLAKNEMKNYRKLNSKTPGHPELEWFDFVDANTGPLGQGIAMALGMAIARDYLAQKFNVNGLKIIDNYVYALHGDGCIQEGVAQEAIQLAGTLKINKLILIHDFNNVQIDTNSNKVNNINLIKWFKAQNWKTIESSDKPKSIEKALKKAKKLQGPVYIQVKTSIGKNTNLENSLKAHAGSYSLSQIQQFKRKMNLENLVPFEYDDEVYKYAQSFWKAKQKEYDSWTKDVEKLADLDIKKYNELSKLINNNYKYDLSEFEFEKNDLSIREYFGQITRFIEKKDNLIIGGSADLKGSTLIGFNKEFNNGGSNISYGVREHLMLALNNGINLASNLRTLGATFLSFADYAKGAIRLASLMKLPVINIFTHDSYGVGEDGPTHQPVEQLAMLRSTPNTLVIRPSNEFESKLAYEYALNKSKVQTCLIASRQAIKSYKHAFDINDLKSIHLVKKFTKTSNRKTINILASGSEVELAYEAANKLHIMHKINVNVYSVPVLQWFVKELEQSKHKSLIKFPTLAIEASSDHMWYLIAKYTIFDAILASEFGLSAPADKVFEKFGFNVENVISKAVKLLNIKSK
ncbi:Transketolase I [Mycoplasmopsis bovigenitalium 51080]|uniref:Transketolase I n=1 Tax=Mycoplasmopsis bovigenitalium 51080 TaxID=1188235 RepID=N9VEP4_9BACT|nr:Transketolase I [Mycoplasmopsis bovigenitalium 51080]